MLAPKCNNKINVVFINGFIGSYIAPVPKKQGIKLRVGKITYFLV